ncbi:MAG: phosphate ABC transporter permease subunit PstC [Chloroflexota bacterium]|nr:phosphate ABC transporter permease subunit PstC [Chloroflexota bacterium]
MSNHPQTRSSFSEHFVERLIRATGTLVILFLTLIFLFLLREGGVTFLEVPLGDLLQTRWYPNEGHFGLLPLVAGSLLVTLGAAAVSLPLGLLTAVFIAEVAPRWMREILKPFIEVLAGIPSVVLGFMGMLVVSPLIREWLNAPTGLTALAGSVMLGYMALPTIISVAEDALDAVPRSYRDAALALGATHWQTIWRVTVPAARSGILTAMMLGVGRAIGETMAVMMVTGNAARLPLTPDSFLMPVRTMTATIAAEMGEVAQGSIHYHVLFAVGLALFLFTFGINLVAAWTIFRQGKRYGRLLS